jgi:integrase
MDAGRRLESMRRRRTGEITGSSSSFATRNNIYVGRGKQVARLMRNLAIEGMKQQTPALPSSVGWGVADALVQLAVGCAPSWGSSAPVSSCTWFSTIAIGPRYGPMILFAAATGLRPAEWIALEKRDVDRDGRVLYVRRAFTRGELKRPKTDASIRAVPLQAKALDALERLPASNGSQLLFPGERGGHLDIHHFRPFQWRPAQAAAGIKPLRRIYDLRHTFATFALRAGISTFDLSRYMGASLTMIDRHYGHLARDGREHAIRLLNDLNATAVDARGRPVDAAKRGRRRTGQRNVPLSRQ